MKFKPISEASTKPGTVILLRGVNSAGKAMFPVCVQFKQLRGNWCWCSVETGNDMAFLTEGSAGKEPDFVYLEDVYSAAFGPEQH